MRDKKVEEKEELQRKTMGPLVIYVYITNYPKT